MIERPAVKDLEALLKQATEGEDQTVAEWQRVFLKNAHALLMRDPLRYRGYGPYWWVLKKELLSAGFDELDQYIDSDWIDTLGYEATPLNLVVCWLYQNAQFEAGRTHFTYHQLSKTDGSVEEYVTGDEHMEQLAVAALL